MNFLKKIFTAEPGKHEPDNKQKAIEITSVEHTVFSNAAIDIFNPLMKEYGFKLLKFRITEYGSNIVWLKDKCYVELGGNTHPHDAPGYYGIALGEFKEDYYDYTDTNSVGLWRLIKIQDHLESVHDTPFPIGEDVNSSLNKSKNDLLKYAKNFLEGDLTQFYFARNEQWNS